MEEYIEYGNALKGADVYYREDWGCYYFSLLGKQFGLMTAERITLKGNPDQNIILREMYSDVKPGYYTNKEHWNSITLDTKQLSKDKIKDMIYISYKLVYNNLSKEDKLIVADMPGVE